MIGWQPVRYEQYVVGKTGEAQGRKVRMSCTWNCESEQWYWFVYIDASEPSLFDCPVAQGTASTLAEAQAAAERAA